ncbi:Gram-negative bacterial tonB protein [compost metagenome]
MKNFRSFRTYVIASFLIHALVVGGLYLFDSLQLPPQSQEAVDIDFISPEQLENVVTQETQKPKKQISRPANQIVEQDAKTSNAEDVDSRFLSATNQKVDKQTIAKERGEFKNAKKPTASPSGPKGDGKEKADTPDRHEKLARDLFKSFDANEALERQKLADKEAGLGKGTGSGDTAAGTGDASQSNDYIKDVDQGLETMLNTREFKYYSYYSRIRRQLAQHWEGRVREKLTKMFKEGRAPAAANQDRITKLMIVLNDRGTLVRVQVLSDSGVRDLDDAAIEAFRQAAPFPNPPKGIIEGDGTVKIRWDFVLEV